MRHIIVLSDDNSIQGEISRTLEQAGYKVSAMEFSAVSSELLMQQPELILLDTSLSNTKAYMLYDKLKDGMIIPEIPILFLVEGDNESILKAVKAGAADVITKPILPEILTNRANLQLELMEYRKKVPEVEKYQDAISVSFAELVECRDYTTGGHLKNTTLYFKILLEEVLKQDKYKHLFSQEEVRDLVRAAPLHDIGKIGINDDILRKASTLNYNEFEYMKTHTILGKETFEKIIKETGGTRVLQLAKDLAYCHHERWDGTGYPSGLKGDEIPLYARILTIADVYDALTSDRAYKEAFSHQKALKIITEGKGSIFDPDLIDIFIHINERFEQALYQKEQEGAVS
ncbi:HD domain-containing protein [Mobilitalea sibirica]|uniref:Stage 0 sporulation protein A homolog n=1 Tax=Mobilitalea sibirica TaxID=1462919 RepID=A0A8J7H2L5_9FIRM|nr:HD domain-containing phosphohydrolase [Mobilitalea sibirica]MBH1941069.1 HD domain-containing protein [Mobilitalea sibirica]